ncbi:MAG TPA: 30S ribosomal protein S16 [Longimicrobiaceae bacterium]
MALKIRLRRMGRKKAPHYRIVIAESTMPRDGRFVATIGHYNPTTRPETLKVDTDKASAWLAKGAVPTDTVRSLLKKAGVGREGGVVETVAAVVTGAAATAGKAARGAASKAAGAAKDVAAKVADVAGDAAAVVADAASTVVETVKDAAESVAEKVTGGEDEAPEAAAAATEIPAEAESPAAEATAADAQVEDALETPVNAQITDEVASTEGDEATPAEGEEPAA